MKNKITVNHEGSFHMGRKGIRIPTDLKLKYAKLCYEGKISFAEAGRQLCVRAQHVVEWTHLYEAQFISSCGINLSINSATYRGGNHLIRKAVQRRQVISWKQEPEGTLTAGGRCQDLRGVRSHDRKEQDIHYT